MVLNIFRKDGRGIGSGKNQDGRGKKQEDGS